MEDVNRGRLIRNGAKFKGIFHVECVGPDGKLKWEDEAENLVTNEGLQHILDILFNSADSASSTVDPWYVGLTNTSPSPAAGDTLSSHAGWTENSEYTGNRQEYVGVRSSQSVTNSASKASFAITSDSQTLGGAFLASVATGSSGTLLCCAAFSGGDKSADNGDTLNVTYTFSAADDGA